MNKREFQRERIGKIKANFFYFFYFFKNISMINLKKNITEGYSRDLIILNKIYKP